MSLSNAHQTLPAPVCQFILLLMIKLLKTISSCSSYIILLHYMGYYRTEGASGKGTRIVQYDCTTILCCIDHRCLFTTDGAFSLHLFCELLIFLFSFWLLNGARTRKNANRNEQVLKLLLQLLKVEHYIIDEF